MIEEVTKAKANLDNAERDLRNMTKLTKVHPAEFVGLLDGLTRLKALKASLVVRLSKWQEFRRHIALRCKLVFGYHLSNRGYYGKILFDHHAGTLQLKVGVLHHGIQDR
jgi:structural maintenance of chromosomes protein 6